MINYKWIIAREFAPIENNLEKVIKSVHWRYMGTEDDITEDVYGAESVSHPEDDEFIHYEEVLKDKNIVIGWLENSLDVEEMKKVISDKIQERKYPKTFTTINPFE